MIKAKDTTVGYHCPFCGMAILNNINIFSMNGNLIKMKCVCGASELEVHMLKDNRFRLTVPCILCPDSHSFTLSSDTFFKKDLFAFTCKFTAINICFIGRDDKVYDALKKNEEELTALFAAYEEEYGGDPDKLDDGFYSDGGGGLCNKAFFDRLNAFDELDDDDDYDDYEYDEYDDIFGGSDDNNAVIDEKKDSGFVLYKNQNFNPDSEDSYGGKADIDTVDNIKARSFQIFASILYSIADLVNQNRIYCRCGNLDGKIDILDKAVHIECANCGSYRDIRAATASDAEYLNGVEALYLDYDD